MAKSQKAVVGRRGFLKTTAVVAALPAVATAQRVPPAAIPPSEAALARESGDIRPAPIAQIIEHPGSDYMVDVIKALGFEYVAANPGTSTGGLHESIVNYGNNSMPEWLTCCHEESAVGMAHGYAKIENKPMLVLLHGTIGIQHAAMAIYNAYGRSCACIHDDWQRRHRGPGAWRSGHGPARVETTLPALIEEVRKLITSDRRRAFDERGKKHEEANLQTRRRLLDGAQSGWDASPISLARLSAELWPLIKNDHWSLVSPSSFNGDWPNRMWDMKKLHHYIGAQGAGGMGSGAPAAVGAALANRKHGRLTINIQTDGDLNYAPGVLWTAVHHKIPLLTIMHNNRGYHQEVMFMAREATIRNRGADRAHIGTKLTDPNIDYAMMAKTYGMYGEGPISDPAALVPALKRGIERVRKGEPVLLDVITQPRG
jgi:thiamine pyrophosphate-dependent acetolactate synthase large subunit-like protein